MSERINYDPDFDLDRLPKLGEYWDGYEINFYPETDPPSVLLECFRIGETTQLFYHNRAFNLWGQPNELVHAHRFKEWLEEHEDTLLEIAEAYETRWNGNNEVGKLPEELWDKLLDFQQEMKDAFQYPEDLPQYWDVTDWFVTPPSPEERNAEALMQEAENLGAFLDLEEIEGYLEELNKEESLERLQGTGDVEISPSLH